MLVLIQHTSLLKHHGLGLNLHDCTCRRGSLYGGRQARRDQSRGRAPLEAAPEKKAVTDLRDLLSRNKRSRDGEREGGPSRPSIKSRISRD